MVQEHWADALNRALCFFLLFYLCRGDVGVINSRTPASWPSAPAESHFSRLLIVYIHSTVHKYACFHDYIFRKHSQRYVVET